MTDDDVYRDGLVHVRAEPCDHCLLSKDRIVSGERARELIASTRVTAGGSFICHRNQVADVGAAICSAWWDAYAAEDPILRLAKALDVVTRVHEDGGAAR